MLILYAVLVLAGLALIFAFGLAVASKIFAINQDPRLVALISALPGVNCGACGFAGCAGYAGELFKGTAEPGKCTVGQKEIADKIGKILGIEVKMKEPEVAMVFCQGKPEVAVEKYLYNGLQSCRAANLLVGGSKSCSYGCLRYGDCYRVCPFDAIAWSEPRGVHPSESGEIPRIIPDKCTACGLCIKSCPKKGLIRLVPENKEVHILCNSLDKGGVTRRICKVGCFACGLCVKACPKQAITIIDNLARIDYSKCDNCGICVEKCPVKTIVKVAVKEKVII
ncbi:MAG TPA: ferredoxin [Elusimicrobia bacterium]|jgi:RnfABCDGE-type electron transport complex B subunit|nr:ferredoxin [Elusimicrobiota bacterium]